MERGSPTYRPSDRNRGPVPGDSRGSGRGGLAHATGTATGRSAVPRATGAPPNPVPRSVRPAPRMASIGSDFDPKKAGAAPKRSAVTSDSGTNARTRNDGDGSNRHVDGPAEGQLDDGAGPSICDDEAREAAGDAPARGSRRETAGRVVCATRRGAARTAVSVRRARPRTVSRFARFAQAMTSTASAIAWSSASVRQTVWRMLLDAGGRLRQDDVLLRGSARARPTRDRAPSDPLLDLRGERA